MPTPFVVQRRVEFCETDMAGIVHFSNYYRYMEQAEHELFRALQLKITGTLPDGTTYGWPRVSATCSFDAPARYEDLILIRATVLRRSARSLTTQYVFERDQLRLAVGEMKTVFCHVNASGQLESADIPPAIATVLDRQLWLSQPA